MRTRTTPTTPSAHDDPSPDDVGDTEMLATPTSELIPLSSIAPELSGTPTVDALAHRLGVDVVLDAIGRRCITPELATLLLDAERVKREAARVAGNERALRNRGERDQKRQQRRDREVSDHLRSLQVDELVNSAGLTPAQALVALDGQPEYEGAGFIPRRPGSNPFTFEEGGRSIGPPRKPRLTRAERKALRDQEAEGSS